MKKLPLLIVLTIILFFGLYFFRVRKLNAPIEISITPTLAIKESNEDQIIQALSEKNNWDISKVELNIITLEGDFARGDVKLKDEIGGGLWFAARVNGAWEIVYDGNGIITCDQLTNYQNFPKDLIPSCYDKQTDKLLTR